MMPLPAAIPYAEAVDIARSAKGLSDYDQGRLVAYMAGWAPELVATAMEDLRLRPARRHGYDTDGNPVMLELAP
jgi:hypothetical protein